MGTDYHGCLELRIGDQWDYLMGLDMIFTLSISEDLSIIEKNQGAPPNPSDRLKEKIESMLSLPNSQVFKAEISDEDWENPDFDFGSNYYGDIYWFDASDIQDIQETEYQKFGDQFRLVYDVMMRFAENYGNENVRAFVYSSY